MEVETKHHYETFYKYGDWKYPSLANGLKMLRYYWGVLDAYNCCPAMKTRQLLDVGCGTGFYTACWAQSDMTVTGIDFSTQAIWKAQKNWGKFASFAIADARNLCFPFDSFDMIFVRGCSLTNTRNLTSIEATAAYYLSFLVHGGVLLWIASSDFSGAVSDGWLNHTRAELSQMFTGLDAKVIGPLYVPPPLRYLYRVGLYRVVPGWLQRQLGTLLCSVGPWSSGAVEYSFIILPNKLPL